MSNITVLIGAQWGDEGKGKLSNHLSRKADIVARFRGGSNAGHTIYKDGHKLILYQIPCGSRDENQLFALISGILINPEEFIQEIGELEQLENFNVTDHLLLSEGLSVINPWHIHLDHKNKSKVKKPSGTTKRCLGSAYQDRVGEGFFPREDLGEERELLGEKGHEFGAITNRKRRCGWFDTVAMRYAQAINGFDSILLNKLDILSGFKAIKVATSYLSVREEGIDNFPSHFNPEEKLKPVYEEFEDWSEDISEVKKFADLSKIAQMYIKNLEKLSGIKVGFIGNSPNKNNFIPC